MNQKKLTRKEKIKATRNEPQNKSLKAGANKSALLFPGLIIALFGFLLYANTLSNGFVLDDASAIKNNFFRFSFGVQCCDSSADALYCYVITACTRMNVKARHWDYCILERGQNWTDIIHNKL